MNFSIPLYIEGRPDEAGSQHYTCRPLFFDAPSRRGTKLQRLQSKVTTALRRHLLDIAHAERHDELAAWGYCPEIRERRRWLTLTLRRKTVRCRPLFVEFEALGKRLAFTPEAFHVWFEVERGADFEARATDALTRYWRDEEKQESVGWKERLDSFASDKRGWVTSVDVSINVPVRRLGRARAGPDVASLAQEGEVSGYTELFRVGRALDWLYPDELDRARLRSREVDELRRLLAAKERRPVLILGPRQVGKSTIVHEVVYHRVRTSSRRQSYGRNVWLLSPQRLISGMIYLGQWEARVLAILREARKRDHVLYFDDVLGLYTAGISASSSVSVAHVLKPFVQRQECRVLAEMTPESWRVLQEKDRGFADLFHVIRVEEPAEADLMRILIGTARQLERQHRARLDVDVLPTVVDLGRRYVRDAAFPGKAAAFLRTLAVKYRKRPVSRDDVLETFQEKSGLVISFLDGRKKLGRRDVFEALASRVVGQREALEAMTDALCVARARLGQPGRPLATLLFLGPTGVGKTECAKALARYLFGEATRLIRFDMNEFIHAHDVSRLSGSFDSPDGLLTGAVRRQPFSVVLFDEIEKAHPAAFDLLLQVLGEGRLTDALGRTSDFSSTVIVLTSNLGVREAARAAGFAEAGRRSEETRAQVFLETARSFFRPEFYNRLDRVIPFAGLTRDEVRQIACLLIDELMKRGGFQQHGCVLQVRPEAMATIVERGFHAELGARALRRALERELVQPVAASMASMAPGDPVLIRVHRSGDGMVVHTEPIKRAARRSLSVDRVDLTRADDVLQAVEAALGRIEHRLDELQPTGALAVDGVSALDACYFSAREHARSVRSRHQRLLDLSRATSRHGLTSARRRTILRRARLDASTITGDRRAELAAADLNEYLNDLVEQARLIEESPERRLAFLVHDAAYLELLVRAAAEPDGYHAILVLTRLFEGDDLELLERIARLYGKWFPYLEVTPMSDGTTGVASLEVDGPGAAYLCALEEGTYLSTTPGGAPLPVLIEAIRPAADEDSQAVLRAHLRRRDAWLAELEAGRARPEDDPSPVKPVIRYIRGDTIIDLRTGLVLETRDWDLRDCQLPLLELPEELDHGG